MGETILIIAIVGVAAAFLLRRWMKLRSGSAGCGCGCGCESSCGKTRTPDCKQHNG